MDTSQLGGRCTGSGCSQIKPATGHCTVAALVDDLEALRREHIQAPRISLLAMRYALAHPDHVEKLVLVSSVPARSQGWRDALDGLRLVWQSGLPPTDPEQADRWFAQTLQRWFRASFFSPGKAPALALGYASFATSMAVAASAGRYATASGRSSSAS